MTPTIDIRPASLDDNHVISDLIRTSATELTKGDYSPATVAAALESGAWGLDTQLIRDRTFYLVFSGSKLAACGGWSFRRTLFGADAEQSRNDELLEPGVDPARIRAFFVHPDFARRGLGSLLLACCESSARLAGFRSFELAATRGGQRLYRARGYLEARYFNYEIGNGLTMRSLLMSKTTHG